MKMNVVSTYPPDIASPAYLDDSIIVRFDEEIEGSYATSQFFLLYRTNEDHSVFYTQISTNISLKGTEVFIKPYAFDANTYYALIIIGGAQGVQSISGSTLSTNYVLYFRTGKAYAPVAPVISTISGEVSVNVIDGEPNQAYSLDEFAPSYDVFTASEEATVSCIISTMPKNMSIGLSQLSTISLVCNGPVVSGCLPESSVEILYSGLPVDSNLFNHPDIEKTIIYHDNVIAIQLSTPLDMENREVVVSVAPGFIRVQDKNVDTSGIELRFLGRLSPFYVTPDYVRMRYMGMMAGSEFPLSQYELAKLIFDKSLFIQETIGITSVDQQQLATIANYITCLLLRDMILMGRALNGYVRSRELLSTRVQYDYDSLSDARGILDDCIKESESLLNVSQTTSSIKSRVWMNRETKTYGVYR